MSWNREQMCLRASKELKDGDYVNLGIGMPTLVANYIDKSLNITLQSENLLRRGVPDVIMGGQA